MEALLIIAIICGATLFFFAVRPKRPPKSQTAIIIETREFHDRVPPRARQSDSLPPISGPTENPFTYDIRYSDAGGNSTHRRITVESIDAFGYLTAWCWSRNARRTFIASRINEMVDPRTGEIISHPRQHLQSQFKQEFDTGSDYRSVMQRARPGIKVLLWIARGDKQVSPRETEIMLDFIDARSRLRKPENYTPDWNPRRAARDIYAMQVTLTDATGGLTIATKSDEEASLLKRFCYLLVMAEGEPEPNAAKRYKRVGLGDFELDESINTGAIE